MTKEIGEIYLKEVKGHYNKRGNWMPGEPLDLGDYGKLKKGKIFGQNFFKRWGNIRKRFGIDFDVKEDPTKDITEFCSAGSVDIESKADAKLLAVGKVSGSINFSRDKMVFIDARGCYYDSIEDIGLLEEKILEKYNKGKGKWKEEFVVVTEIMRAKGATVVVTSGGKASIGLEAEAKLPLTMKLISDPSIGLKATSVSNIGHRNVAEEGLKLMMETHKVRDTFFGDPELDYSVRYMDRFETPTAPPPKEREISLVKALD